LTFNINLRIKDTSMKLMMMIYNKLK
jgi:hypothetical protein